MCEHSSMPPKENRQTLMFSATFPSEVQQLALGEWKFIRFIWNIYIWLPFFLSIDFLKDYLFLTIGILGSANSDVTQKFVEVCNLLFLDTKVSIVAANFNIFYLINWIFAAETILGNTVHRMIILILCYYHLCILMPSGRKI